MQRRISLLLVVILLSSVSAFAQKAVGTVKGFVYDKKTGEPMIYTNVLVEEEKTLGAQTDGNGYFSLSLPVGSYTLYTTSIGYDTTTISVTLLANEIITRKLFISPLGMQLKSVEVSAHKIEKTTQINVGVTSITPREIKLLPSAGGEPDVAQFLQVVPGVVFTGDQGGQLYVRGGSPAQTGILLDGVTIYNPFHSIGLFSVFETESIRNVDVYSAGFNAEYGNRTSAIVDVHTKDGNKNNLAGLVSVSPIMARAMLEGPLVKSKKANGSGITFLFSGKTSYLDQTSKSIYAGLGDEFKAGLPYGFTDLYGKVTFNADNGSKLNVFGFNFNDKAQLLDAQTHATVADYKWKARGAGATFVVSPGSSTALIDGKFAYSNYNINYQEASSAQPRTTGIDGFEAGLNFTYFLPHYSELKYGIEVSGFHTALSYYVSPGITTTLDRYSTLGGIYAVYRKNFNNKFIMEPSIRVQYYSEVSKLAPQPRLGLKYNITSTIRLKASTGLYAQNIISTKSDRDIVNFFSGFLLSPAQQIYDENGQPVNSKLQTAFHAAGGLEVDVNRVELNLEPWMKNFTQLVEFNRNKLYSADPDFVAGNGKAVGLDLSAKYSNKRVYLWGVVSYQKVRYTNIGPDGKVQTYPPPFDRGFNSNFVASYTAGKKSDWEFSGRYSLGSPFPFTQTQGFYENNNPVSTGVNTNYLTQNGNIGVIYSNEINGGRLSWYHRFDLSVRKRFYFSERSNLDVTLSVTNLYNRNNAFYIDRITNTIVYQLPIFPSLNLTWKF